jgi:GTP cyclohydrolase I
MTQTANDPINESYARLPDIITDALYELLQPRAVAVRIRGRHLCMMMRGVEKQQSSTISESAKGIETLTNLEQQRLFAALAKN